MAERFPPVRVNIVEEPGWKTWEPGGDIGIWASDNAWEEWTHLDETSCERLIDELTQASLPQRQWKLVGPVELERMCTHLKKEGWTGDLESTYHSILDASTWAWEEAYTPSDTDIQLVMEKVYDHSEIEVVGDYWDLVVGRKRVPGMKLWRPGAKEWDEASALTNLFNQITYERKPDWYDRHLIFDFGNAKVVKDLLEHARKIGQEKEVVHALRQDFDEWKDQYLAEFFRLLEGEIQDVDAGNRVDFRKYWRRMLRDKQQMKAVGTEILEFLKKPADKEEEE